MRAVSKLLSCQGKSSGVVAALAGVCVMLAGTGAAHADWDTTRIDWEHNARPETLASKGIVFDGNAGLDQDMGLAYHGKNNAWARGYEGWNAVTHKLQSSGLGQCALKVALRVSPGMSNMYVSILDSDTKQILRETGPLHGGMFVDGRYVMFEPWEFKKGNLSLPAFRFMSLRVGFWGNGQDNWVQIDDIEWSCAKNEVKGCGLGC